jgi:hypothetical protein
VKLYLASTSTREKIVLELLEKNIIIPYLLESFVYIKPFQLAYKKYVKNFMLDSGAFTFINNTKNTSLKSIEIFVGKYIDFINKNDIDLFFEMDIDNVIGLSEVEKLREKIENETGKKSIPVFHPERGKQYYLDLVKKYNYVSLGGSVTKKWNKKMYEKSYPWFIKEAKKQNCKIHGLGFTALTKLKLPQYQFTSVDSSTWVHGVRFHNYFKFENENLKRNNLNTKYKKNNYEITMNNLQEWIKYANYLNKLK